MKTQSINVLGYTGQNSQFVVKTSNTDLRISPNATQYVPQTPNPYEYILAGFAGCINALGHAVAKEFGIVLRSLQVEISGSMNTLPDERPGFDKIEITLRPAAAAPLDVLQQWMEEVQFRSPVYDTPVNNTPVSVNLYKDYSAVN
nr:OsmC family protein [uncultured Flavobacterium sp.]